MRIAPAIFPLLLVVLVGCGGSEGPIAPVNEFPVVPQLESVAFALLGSGRVAFQRLGPPGSEYVATYVIDATAARSWHMFDNTVAEGPAISPDGRKITFMNFMGISATGWDVYLSKSDGTEVTQLTKLEGEGAASWSADGSKLVFPFAQGMHRNFFSQSPVVNATDLKQHTHFTADPGGHLICPYLFGWEDGASISSQGRITFNCAATEIDVLATDGTLAAAYVASRSDRSRFADVYMPQWSPDETKIAFLELTWDVDATPLSVNGYALKLMNPDATNVTTIASGLINPAAKVQPGGTWSGPHNLSLCWMPDGSRIVFNLPEAQLVSHLWVVKADGTGLTQLTSAPDVYDRSVSCSRS
ncbi:MAG: TolB family protein [Gemmatimonadaceae bacterium]